MKKEYIPVLVDRNGKQEQWRIDITKLSIAQLIELKKEILSNDAYGKTIEILDAMIQKNIETTIPTHNISSYTYVRKYKKNKKEEKLKIKIKSKRRKYNDKYKR